MEDKIQFIHDSNLEAILLKLGLLENIRLGKIECFFCKKTITLDNLQGVYYRDGQLCVSCDDILCVEKLKLRMNSEVK